MALTCCQMSYAQRGTSHYFFSPNSNPPYVMVTVWDGYMLMGFNPVAPIRVNMVKRDGRSLTYQGGDLIVIMASDMSMMTAGRVGGNGLTYTYCGPAGGGNAVSPSGQVPPAARRADSGPRTYKCQFCNGTGKVVKNDHVPQYGSNSYSIEVRCNECGTVYNSTYTNHYHMGCSHCGGTGQITR